MMHTISKTRDSRDDVEASSFEEYAAASWPTLYRYAYLLAGNHADAEDIAQQTLVKAHAAWSRIAASDSPPAYLRRMVTNTFLSQRRPKARRLEVVGDPPPDVGPTSETSAPRPLSAVEDRMVLWPHVSALPPRQRAVIVLRYYEDLSEQEIADALGCSRGTVKSSAHHALASLRAALASGDPDQNAPSEQQEN